MDSFCSLGLEHWSLNMDLWPRQLKGSPSWTEKQKFKCSSLPNLGHPEPGSPIDTQLDATLPICLPRIFPDDSQVLFKWQGIPWAFMPGKQHSSLCEPELLKNGRCSWGREEVSQGTPTEKETLGDRRIIFPSWPTWQESVWPQNLQSSCSWSWNWQSGSNRKNWGLH
jgi:hypothetical protein